MVGGREFVEHSYRVAVDLFGVGDTIPITDNGIEHMRDLVSSEGIGDYGQALFAAGILLLDAEERTLYLRKRIPPWRKQQEQSSDATYTIFLYGCFRMLQTYKEPAETIISLLQAVTGKPFEEPIYSRAKLWLDLRTSKEANLFESTEGIILKDKPPEVPLKPSPFYLGPKVRALQLEAMREDPSGMRVLTVMQHALTKKSGIYGVRDHIEYAFGLGLKRYQWLLAWHGTI